MELLDFSSLPVWATPTFIYFAKIIEIALLSIRFIMISRGFRFLSMIIAMLESLVWVSILGVIFTNLDNLLNVAAFTLGMGTGTLLGIFVEKKLALGLVMVRLITQKPSDTLLTKLRDIGFRVTSVKGNSNYGTVQILFAAVKRKNIDEFAAVVRHFNPNAFFTIEDIREASQVIKNSSKVANLDMLIGKGRASLNPTEKTKNTRNYDAKRKPYGGGRGRSPHERRNRSTKKEAFQQRENNRPFANASTNTPNSRPSATGQKPNTKIETGESTARGRSGRPQKNTKNYEKGRRSFKDQQSNFKNTKPDNEEKNNHSQDRPPLKRNTPPSED